MELMEPLMACLRGLRNGDEYDFTDADVRRKLMISLKNLECICDNYEDADEKMCNVNQIVHEAITKFPSWSMVEQMLEAPNGLKLIVPVRLRKIIQAKLLGGPL